MGHVHDMVALGIRIWWVNVYPERQHQPLSEGIWHACPNSARVGRGARVTFGEQPALYVVRVRCREAA